MLSASFLNYEKSKMQKQTPLFFIKMKDINVKCNPVFPRSECEEQWIVSVDVDVTSLGSFLYTSTF